jgi:hypothetical protein
MEDSSSNLSALEKITTCIICHDELEMQDDKPLVGVIFFDKKYGYYSMCRSCYADKKKHFQIINDLKG